MGDSKAEVRKGMEEIQKMMESMNIEIHKWGTNCVQLLAEIPQDKRAKVVEMGDPEREAIKALGLVWDTETDTLLFPKGPPTLEPRTLRSMTSSAGQLFDPTGLVTPTSLPAKLLIQHAWRYQDEWDEEVPQPLAKK